MIFFLVQEEWPSKDRCQYNKINRQLIEDPALILVLFCLFIFCMLQAVNFYPSSEVIFYWKAFHIHSHFRSPPAVFCQQAEERERKQLNFCITKCRKESRKHQKDLEICLCCWNLAVHSGVSFFFSPPFSIAWRAGASYMEFNKQLAITQHE